MSRVVPASRFALRLTAPTAAGLRPQGLVPEENRVAEILGQLLGGVWGCRVLVHDRCCLRRLLGHGVERPGWLWAALRRNGVRTLLQPLKLGRQWIDEAFLKNVFVVVVLALLRILLYLIMGEPVGLLKLAGGIEAAHIPIVTGLILYLNGRMLPHDLRPSRVVCTATAAAGLFFAAFAGIYVSSW